jgi:predicted AAA+ superfamily ATPase
MAVDRRFLPHNLHQQSSASQALEAFQKNDPHLRQLNQLSFPYKSNLLGQFPISGPLILTLTGGRQVGKTTLLKQWMLQLLKNEVPAGNIFYLTGDIIDDHHSLVRMINDLKADISAKDSWFLIIDEITYIRDWDRGIKFLADSGVFENAVVMLTGSDHIILKEARARFPGRRGKSETRPDFHLSPLSFYDYVHLAEPKISSEMPSFQKKLFGHLTNYFIHGGFLTAINEYHQFGKISLSTYLTYTDWIRGDLLKKGKSEENLREVLSAITKTYGSQVSWNSLSDHISIDHPQTVSDYIHILASMDVLYIQNALKEDKLSAAPKKAKKIHFTDPFIFRAVEKWLNTIETGESFIVESISVSHFARKFPTYYIKGDGEVDIAAVQGKSFLPVEIKWTDHISMSDLKQLKKYKNGEVWAKINQERKLESMLIKSLPLELWKLK